MTRSYNVEAIDLSANTFNRETLAKC